MPAGIPIWDSRQLDLASRQDENKQRGRSIAAYEGPGFAGLKTNLLLRVDDPVVLKAVDDKAPARSLLDPSPLNLVLTHNGYLGRAIEVMEGRIEREDGLSASERQDLLKTSQGLVSSDFKVFRKGRPWTNNEAYLTLFLGLALGGLGLKWIHSSRAEV